MTRSELIQRIAEGFPQLTQKDAQVAVDHLVAAVTEALADERRVEIRGFGSFCVHRRPARLGRNPKTGKPVSVPPKRAPHFKPGKALLESLNIQNRRAQST